jgi:hypothetical protein
MRLLRKSNSPKENAIYSNIKKPTTTTTHTFFAHVRRHFDDQKPRRQQQMLVQAMDASINTQSISTTTVATNSCFLHMAIK